MLISDWSSDVCSSDPPLCGIANVASVIDREGLDAGTAGKFVEIRRDRHIFEETADRARSVEGSLRAPQHLDPGEVIWKDRRSAAVGKSVFVRVAPCGRRVI